MSLKVFRNARAARKHQSNIVLNLNAVDNQLKPCYLWDAFNADVSEIQQYLNCLQETGSIANNLKAFTIDDTVFITRYDNMSDYANVFDPENVGIVDVSNINKKPLLLCPEEKRRVLSPIKDIMQHFPSNVVNLSNNFKILNGTVNMTTLFGALLGYPVLYWYKTQNPDVDFTCLSMVPLRVYSVSPASQRSICDNNLISFSIPEEFCDKTAHLVDSWYRGLLSRCKNFGRLKLFQHTVTLPTVAM